jgi:hypothetical protein
MSIDSIISEFPAELRLRLEQDAERAKRMTSGAHLQDWLDYEVGLQGIRSEAMRLTFSNQPKGRAYNEMVGHLMKHYGFDHLDSGSITSVLWLTDPEPKYFDARRKQYLTRKEILTGILKGLTPGQRSRVTSPTSARQRVAKGIEELAAEEAKAKALAAGQEIEESDADTDGKPLSKLKQVEQSLARVLQEKYQLEEKLKRRDDGSLFDLKRDNADDIVEAIAANVSTTKAETIAKGLLARVKRKQQVPAG